MSHFTNISKHGSTATGSSATLIWRQPKVMNRLMIAMRI